MRPFSNSRPVDAASDPSPAFLSPGLISQVAEELWEVKDKQLQNLTKQDLTIVDYKNGLAKRSQAAIAKAKLGGKGK